MFIKGDEFLFRNKNLKFQLDKDEDIRDRISDFMLEIGGLKSSEIMAQPRQGSMSQVAELQSPLQVDEFGFVNVGLKSKVYQPSITDMKLLIGTKQWEEVMEKEGIDENTIDPEFKEEAKKEQGDGDSSEPQMNVIQ